jgi:adenine-specific DNA-methyltransferase
VKIERNSDTFSTRKADYAFFLSPDFQRPQFLVEAKKPSQSLENPDYYFQTARYGFNTSTSVALLFSFAALHVIDCRRKPERVDSILMDAHLRSFTYNDYLDREKFEWIYWRFSREAVEAGNLKAYWKELPKPRGRARQLKLIDDRQVPPDDAFLEDLDGWRKTLASAFRHSNPNLSSEALTEAAQKTLDRLVFIRFLEDKQITGFIIEKFGTRGSAWKRFIMESERLDGDYNGVVFNHDFIDDETFRPPNDDKFFEIVEEIRHDNSPYLFSYISVELLGSIYERFLGKVVIPKGKGVTLDWKPAYRKAQGVYYTPKYIVDYIVEHTVGKILEGKKPIEIAPLKFADISCGSGSFLIAIFDAIRKHLETWYHEHPEDAVADGCRQDSDGRWVLTLEQKRRILTENIYGVDLDPQAVEVAQFSLFLKLLEAETISTVEGYTAQAPVKKATRGQMTFASKAHRKILPNLSKNIVRGNSLVDHDIGDLFPLTEENEKRINPFSFESVFREAMSRIKFDAIVGNPPYFSLSTLDANIQKYFLQHYDTFDKTGDIYCLFYEKSIRLLKPGGFACYITSNQWLQTNYGRKLQRFFVENSNPKLLINFGGFKIFHGATVDTSILLLKNEPCDNHLLACHFKNDYGKEQKIEEYFEKNALTLQDLQSDKWEIIDDDTARLKTKLKKAGAELKYFPIKINYGIKSGYNEAFIIDTETRDRLYAEDPRSKEIIIKVLRGRDIHKYTSEWADLWLIVTQNGTVITRYPAIFKHLKKHEKALRARQDQGDEWWNLRACTYYEAFEDEKLIYPETTVRRSEFFLDRDGFFLDKTAFMITGEDLAFLNGILSSKLMEWYLETELRLLGKKSIQYSKQFMDKVPIPISPDKTVHDKITNFVDQMLATKKQLATVQRDSERERIQQKCDYFGGEIDKLVYQLYGLTTEEIGIVMGV